MSQPSPELVEAYNLIKAGQRQEAGRILKNYLAQNKSDPQAWWLMANAATQPETIRRCLETVLNLDPTHAKARARLDKLLAESGAPEEASPPPSVPRAESKPAAPPPFLQTESAPALPPRAASKPALPPRAAPNSPAAQSLGRVQPAAPPRKPFIDDEFPPDELVLAGIVIAQAAAASPALARAPAPAAAPPPKAASFEDFLTAAPVSDRAPVDDPFAAAAAPPAIPVAASSEDLFAPARVAPSEPYNPFDSARTFNPAAYANLGSSSTGEVQAPGTGTQPEWGPGWPCPDAVEVPLDEDEFDYQQVKPRIERMLRVALIVIGVFILFAVVLWFLDSAGWLNVGGDSVPDMTTLDAGSFTIEYPRTWDMRCAQDPSGYPVCGIANHEYYNEVDYFAFQDIDLGAMLADAFNPFSGQDLPDQQISVIVMDVPRTSPSYDNGSWAKTKYEWSQSGWVWDDNAKIDYDKKEMTIDGLTAYYYEYISKGSVRDAAWDVYIEHDGIILWFRVDYYGPRSEKIPEKTIQAMIDSINIKSVEER
jgi:hypothetical protein